VLLGNPKIAKARKSAVASIKALADQHAANVLAMRSSAALSFASGSPATKDNKA
jgi:hypothetical protein